MSESNSRNPRQHAGGRTVLHRALLSGASILFVAAACHGNGTAPEDLEVYRIIQGACGDVIFSETIGTDSASAFRAVEARKIAAHGVGNVRLEAHALEVVDKYGNAPQHAFYALHVLQTETASLVHSVAEVITTKGDLFTLRWCRD